MKTIILTTLAALALLTILFGVSGLSLMAVLYVPANLGLPVFLMTALYHYLIVFLTDRNCFFHALWPRIALALLLVVAFTGGMFLFDILLFNSHLNARDLLQKDYRGWLFRSVPAALIVPMIHKYLTRQRRSQ